MQWGRELHLNQHLGHNNRLSSLNGPIGHSLPVAKLTLKNIYRIVHITQILMGILLKLVYQGNETAFKPIFGPQQQAQFIKWSDWVQSTHGKTGFKYTEIIITEPCSSTSTSYPPVSSLQHDIGDLDQKHPYLVSSQNIFGCANGGSLLQIMIMHWVAVRH